MQTIQDWFEVSRRLQFFTKLIPWKDLVTASKTEFTAVNKANEFCLKYHGNC